MNILLALDSSYGINSFEQFSSIFIPILLFLIVWLLLYILPASIIANAIKKTNSSNNQLRIVKEYNDCFKLDNDILIYKKWYDEENDLYIAPYGFYIPIYNYQKDVVSFVYERKSI